MCCVFVFALCSVCCALDLYAAFVYSPAPPLVLLRVRRPQRKRHSTLAPLISVCPAPVSVSARSVSAQVVPQHLEAGGAADLLRRMLDKARGYGYGPRGYAQRIRPIADCVAGR